MKRHSTTAIASVVLTWAALCFIDAIRVISASYQLDSANIRAAYRVVGVESPAVSIYRNFGWWALFSSVCAVVTGVALAIRSSRAFLLSVGTALLTAFIAAYGVLVLAPLQTSVPGCSQPGRIGSWVVGLLSVIAYLSIAVYLRSAKSRAEFQGGSRVAA